MCLHQPFIIQCQYVAAVLCCVLTESLTTWLSQTSNSTGEASGQHHQTRERKEEEWEFKQLPLISEGLFSRRKVFELNSPTPWRFLKLQWDFSYEINPFPSLVMLLHVTSWNVPQTKQSNTHCQREKLSPSCTHWRKKNSCQWCLISTYKSFKMWGYEAAWITHQLKSTRTIFLPKGANSSIPSGA